MCAQSPILAALILATLGLEAGHAFAAGDGGSGSRGDGNCAGGQLPCYYEPTIVFGPPCPGNPNAFHTMFPRAINSAGQVVGEYEGCLSPTEHAFVWTAEQGLLSVPEPPQTVSSSATDIIQPADMNDLGHVCGHISIIGQTGPRGFVFDWRGLTLLEPLPGDPSSFAEAINAQHIAVGRSTGNQHLAVMWTDAQPVQIPGLLGPDSEAKDINDVGEITGWMGEGPAGEGSHAFLWQNGQVTELQIPDGALSLDPQAISNDQEIVGYIRYPDPRHFLVFRGFTWSAGVLTELPVLPEYTHGLALEVSDPGMVVGFSTGLPGEGLPERAVLWHDGAAYDLNDMVRDPDDVIFLRRALGINSAGFVAVLGRFGPENDDHTILFVLTPVYPAIGDLDCDGGVGASDLVILLAQWGAGDSLSADFNGDGVVGPFDLGQLLANWGSSSQKGGDFYSN